MTCLVTALNADFHCLTKMCFLWSDLPKLRADMSRVSASTLRSRLLTAAGIMQSALGTENFGVTFVHSQDQALKCLQLTQVTVSSYH